MKAKRPLFKHLNIDDYTNSDLDAAVNYIENTELSAVRTKYNKKANWEAISIRGYSSDPNYILKPGVLGNEDKGEFLQDTTLKQIPECAALYRIIESIPAEFDRIRVMRLKAGTKISKHTDKIDKSIGFEDGEIVRIHVPIKTDPKVVFSLYEKDVKNDFFMAKGKYYYIDITKAHEVHNAWDQDRLHLVIDCYSNQKLRDMILA